MKNIIGICTLWTITNILTGEQQRSQYPVKHLFSNDDNPYTALNDAHKVLNSDCRGFDGSLRYSYTTFPLVEGE